MEPIAIELSGDLVLGSTDDLYERIAAAARGDAPQVVLDFSRVGRFDASGAIAVQCGQRALADAGKQLSLHNLAPHHQAVIDMTPLARRRLEPRRRPGLVELTGEVALTAASRLRCLAHLLAASVRIAGRLLTRRGRLPSGSFVEQLSRLGTDAVPIVALLGLLLGLILGVQAVEQLSRYGAEVFAADLVGLSLVRELGPILVAIILIGRSGAAIASELGTMQVNQEVDALRTMGIDPIQYLAVPRIAALLVAQPLLTVLAVFAGIFGGMVVVNAMAEISMPAYFFRTVDAVGGLDLAFGLSKSAIYALVIGVTGCAVGLDLRGGPSAVGRATTSAVVLMILLVVVSDFAFTVGDAVVTT